MGHTDLIIERIPSANLSPLRKARTLNDPASNLPVSRDLLVQLVVAIDIMTEAVPTFNGLPLLHRGVKFLR